MLDKSSVSLSVDDVVFVKELYPRLREDDAAIERYRAAIDKLPPIIVARGNILVDGFHRWQAYKREGISDIAIEDLGNLADIQILKESIRRNSTHGRQLETKDKRRMADQLYRQGVRDDVELAELLSITPKTLAEYLRDARRDEKEEQKTKAWDLWLDCFSEREIEDKTGIPRKTVNDWITGRISNELDFRPPASRQHFDVWEFQKADGESSYFGRLPPQVVENILWFYTKPGDIIVDPFVGGGTTIDVCKSMARRIWASDLIPSTPILPIHQHNILDGWPKQAPKKANLIILDPPYWQQAAGKYSNRPEDLGNMTLDDFMSSWASIINTCSVHRNDGGRIAYIISPSQCDDGTVVDHATEMLRTCWDNGLSVERRIIVQYQTQQANGQQVEWARENKRMLKLYRDLIILK